MKIINTLNKISNIYSNGSFDIIKWKEYISFINPKLEHLCINDMNEAISTGLVTFEKNYLPDNIGKNTRKWLKDYFKLLNL